MTDENVIPNHTDHARVWRVCLPMIAGGNIDDVLRPAAETQTDRDTDCFFVAACDCFAFVVKRRHPNPIAHVEAWIAYELDQPDIDPDDDSAVPWHLDRARAMRAVLASLTADYDAVERVGREPTTRGGIFRLMLALCDCLGIFIAKNLREPITYVENWIALELELAEQAGE